MVSLEKACYIIQDAFPEYYIDACDDGGNCYIFGMRKLNDEPDRALRGPFRVDKTTGAIDKSMTVNAYLDYILEHDQIELDFHPYQRRQFNTKRAS